MTYTRGEASGLLAAALGCPQMVLWFCGWSSNEIQCGVGCNHPQNNLWACGQAAPGATDWNPQGVKNYPSLTEAIAAMVANLNDPRYPAYQSMVHDLQQSMQDSANIRAGLQTWCGSTCYSNSAGQFVATGQAHAQDQFDDTGSTTAPPTTPLTTPQCVQCGPAKLECCEPMSCVGGLCVLPPTAGAANVAQNGINFLLPGWLENPDWPRLGKWLVGALLVVVGAILIINILTGKLENTPAVKAATRAVELGAA